MAERACVGLVLPGTSLVSGVVFGVAVLGKACPHEGQVLDGQTLLPCLKAKQDDVISVETKEGDMVPLFVTISTASFQSL